MFRYLITIALSIIVSLGAYAQSYFDKGLAALDEKDYASALENFQREVEINQSNAVAHFFLGRLYYDNHSYGQSLKSFDAAIKYGTDSKSFMSDAYRLRAGVYVSLDKTDEAMADLAMAIKTNPKNADAYDDRGDLYYGLEEYDKSDKDYFKAIKLEPEDPRHLIGVGRNAEARKDYETALNYYTKAVNVRPDYGGGYRFRACVFALQEKYQSFAEDIVKALECNDDVAFLVMQDNAKTACGQLLAELESKAAADTEEVLWKYFQAVVLEVNDRYAEAITLYDKVNFVYPSSAFDKRIASCYDKICRWDKAVEYINAAIQKDPGDEDAVVTRAGYKYSYGDYSGAIADITRCIDSHPDLDWLYLKRGWYELNMRYDDEALKDFSEALELNPEDADSYLKRGAILLLRGNKEQAEDDFRRVLELDSDVEHASFSASYAYAYLGLTDEAESCMNRILDNSDDDDIAGACYEAACLYSILNKQETALEYLEKAIKGGFNHYFHLLNDRDIDNIRNTEKFKALLKENWPACLSDEGIVPDEQ